MDTEAELSAKSIWCVGPLPAAILTCWLFITARLKFEANSFKVVGEEIVPIIKNKINNMVRLAIDSIC